MQVAMTIQGQSMVLSEEDLHNILDAIKYASRNSQDKGPQWFGTVQVESVRYGAPGAQTMADRNRQHNRMTSGTAMFNGRMESVDSDGCVLADF